MSDKNQIEADEKKRQENKKDVDACVAEYDAFLKGLCEKYETTFNIKGAFVNDNFKYQLFFEKE